MDTYDRKRCRVLAVIGTVSNFVLQFIEDDDAAKLEQDLREGRVAVRAGFDETAHAVELHYDKATDTYVDQTIGKRIAEIDEELEELRNMQESRSGLFQELYGLLDDTRGLISEMHSS